LSFEQTPLFQLNLFLYLGIPGSNGIIRPILFERGYSIYCIAPNLTTSLTTLLQGNNASRTIKLQRSTSPDVLFTCNDNNHLLIVECKKSRFPLESDQARQVSTMLTFRGPDLANYFGFEKPENWQSLLELAVSFGHGEQTVAVTQELAERLYQSAIQASEFGVLEIVIRNDGAYLLSFRPEDGEFCFKNEKVMFLEEGEDPRPLYLIPIDPSIQSNDEYELATLRERVRASVVENIGKRLDLSHFEISQDEICRSAIPVWDKWFDRNSKRSLKTSISKYLGDVAREMKKLGLDIAVQSNMVECKNINVVVADKVKRYLTSKEFKAGFIEISHPDQMPLSDDWL